MPRDMGVAGPVLHDCGAHKDPIDPYGRELWLSSVVRRPVGSEPTVLYVVGAASSEVWLNGDRLGANGLAGGSKQRKLPGAMRRTAF